MYTISLHLGSRQIQLPNNVSYFAVYSILDGCKRLIGFLNLCLLLSYEVVCSCCLKTQHSHACVCVCVCVCACVCECVQSVCVCVCMYVCVGVRVCVFVCIIFITVTQKLHKICAQSAYYMNINCQRNVKELIASAYIKAYAHIAHKWARKAVRRLRQHWVSNTPRRTEY